jgi:hypothetical protein
VRQRVLQRMTCDTDRHRIWRWWHAEATSLTFVKSGQTSWSEGWEPFEELQRAMPVFVGICVRAGGKSRFGRLVASEAKSSALFDLRCLRQKREMQTGRAEVSISATLVRRN